jgi:hypothetical protein
LIVLLFNCWWSNGIFKNMHKIVLQNMPTTVTWGQNIWNMMLKHLNLFFYETWFETIIIAYIWSLQNMVQVCKQKYLWNIFFDHVSNTFVYQFQILKTWFKYVDQNIYNFKSSKHNSIMQINIFVNNFVKHINHFFLFKHH